MKSSPENIQELAENEIFVFGSNKDGLHYSGAAKLAHEKFGAEWGVGNGLAGKTYAINTMSGIDVIEHDVDLFLLRVKKHPNKVFLVTEIGCGIAGYKPKEIAPFFKNCPKNVHLPKSFIEVLTNKK
jgi:hypothetical protein